MVALLVMGRMVSGKRSTSNPAKDPTKETVPLLAREERLWETVEGPTFSTTPSTPRPF
jgi:hypothetical protein